MFSNQSAEVLLNVPIRALDAVRADKVDSKFLVGSSSIDTDNHLHLLRFQPDLDELKHDASILHPTGPISQIVTSPNDPSLVLTRTEDSMAATLWKIPLDVLNRTGGSGDGDVDDDDDGLPPLATMEELAKLSSSNDNTKQIVDIKWRGGGVHDDEDSPPTPSSSSSSGQGDVLTLDEAGTLTKWDVAFGTAESSRTIQADISESTWNLPSRMAWDPHSVDVTAISAGTSIKLIDWRSNAASGGGGGGGRSVVQSFSGHRYGVTDLDYNPNKPYVLATAGQDGLLKFWDLRSSKTPLLVSRGGHRHWVSRVSYNPFHDQLVLSAGTDSIVNLWRISTISSAPLLTFDAGADDANPNTNAPPSETAGPNVRVSRYEHMDSCYGLAWGAADAWVYASIGYDGKVALNQVPSKEKYKILL